MSTSDDSGVCKNAIQSYRSSIEYSLPLLEIDDSNIEYVTLTVPHCTIPCTWYNVDYYNCALCLSVSGTETLYHLQYGNYSYKTFKAALQTLLGSSWSVTLDEVTARFTLQNVSSLEFIVIYSKSTIGKVMGFDANLTSASYIVVFSYVANFNQFPRINFHCKELANSCQVQSNRRCVSDVFLSCPNGAPILGTIIYHGSGISSIISRDVLHNLKTIRIDITDDDDNLINFNSGIVTFSLQWDIYRRLIPRPLLTISELVDSLNR